jgi:hypothetical protein
MLIMGSCVKWVIWMSNKGIQMKNSFNVFLGFNLINGVLNLKNIYIKNYTFYKGLCHGLS